MEYYDYINFFIKGNRVRLEEYYGRGGFDPIENKYGYKYDVESTTYYDEQGNIISPYKIDKLTDDETK